MPRVTRAAVGVVASAGLAVLLTAGNLGAREPASEVVLERAYAKVPMAFEPNRGQADGDAAFLTHGSGYSIEFRPAEARFALGGRGSLRMQVAGGNASARLVPEHQLAARVNYLLGADRSRWHTGIPTFGRLKARDVYPGIDLVYHGTQGQLEYDFVVRPGARPQAISLRFPGAARLQLERGDLLIHTRWGTLRQRAPFVFQRIERTRRVVEGRFVLHGQTLGFAVGEYDRTRPLVIDPALVYSTYIGGSTDDAGHAIALDAAGNAYVTGCTGSACANAMLVKLSPSGSLVYATQFGGSGDDTPIGIAVDSGGNAVVTGFTASTDWPTVGAYQSSNAGGDDAFVTKVNATGSGLLYSSYLGGSADDVARDVALDGTGNIVITGWTLSTNFPTAAAFQPASAGGEEGFVTKLNPSGSTLLYSTYLGGTGDDEPGGVALDTGGIYLTGATTSTNFPTMTPYQASFKGSVDGFVTKLNAAGSALVYSTYLGGSSIEFVRGIDVDEAGNAYVGGYTLSTDFPTQNPYQPSSAGDTDGFVTKLSSTGNALVYSTYLGGSGGDVADGPAVDSGGNAYLSGYTRSTNFPTVAPVQPANGGGQDAFAAKLNASGSALDWSTYLGGSGREYGLRVRADDGGNAYVVGWTESANFPTANAFQGSTGGALDAFVTKLSAPPTAVAVRGLSARSTRGGVILRWRSGSDIGLAGFDVFRAGRRLNARLIAAAGVARGSSYTFRDRPAAVAIRTGCA